MQVLGAMELLMSAFPADAPRVLEAPLQRLLAALLAGSETGQVTAGMTFALSKRVMLSGDRFSEMHLHPWTRSAGQACSREGEGR